MQRKVKLELDHDIIHLDSFIPFDFRKNMGTLAVELTYTNGDRQMLTTKSMNSNCHGTYEFDTEEDYHDFIKKLKDLDIIQVRSSLV